jgi:hypothetical protein
LRFRSRGQRPYGLASSARIVVFEEIDQDRSLRGHLGAYDAPHGIGDPPDQQRTLPGLEPMAPNDVIPSAGGRVDLRCIVASTESDEVSGRRNSGTHDIFAAEYTPDLGRVHLEGLRIRPRA